MGVVLVTVGASDPVTLDVLQDNLRRVLQKDICVGDTLSEPGYAFNTKRNQFLSTAILKVLLEQKDLMRYGKSLSVVDRGLYAPELNFIFGHSTRAAIISLARLRET